MEIVSYGRRKRQKRRQNSYWGGHEFTSRFILGSGKFSLDLVKACIEKAEAQIITLHCAVQTKEGLQISSITSRKTSHSFQIPPVQEMQKKQSVSQDFLANSAAEIS